MPRLAPQIRLGNQLNAKRSEALRASRGRQIAFTRQAVGKGGPLVSAAAARGSPVVSLRANRRQTSTTPTV